MSRHFLIRILPSERPFNTAVVGISAVLPGVDLGNDGVAVRQTPIQALAIQDANFNFRHIEPTGVFRGVVKYDTAQEDFRFFDAEHVLETLAEMGIEIIHDQMDVASCGIDLFEQIANEGYKVQFGPVVSDQNCSPSAFGLHRHKQIAGANTHVFIILPNRHSRTNWQRRPGILEQLFALFIQTNNGLSPAERSGIETEQIVHPLPILPRQFANTPHQLAPRLEAVFLADDGPFRG